MDTRIYIAVGIGGMIGALLRYAISMILAGDYVFPYATLITNFIGCFLLSFLLNHSSIRSKLRDDVFTGLTTGLIGAFTTFSTFAVETIELWNENVLFALLYTGISMIGGLAFCFMGFMLSTKIKMQGAS
ncbi:fluoride efflux transporter CrcB [Oceanobacillus bengalensis]|uniref:Fluoride-specific ion channel FluC n=1 Tax=Oceanobacillus bengalensis TaxID=1435466 RepID=A0A494YXZ8_9BACI|nr:fluoride efflux transporter CrcB [Oceanobacillus bengalensis]RKQ14996.1 fluoride efflux transporter CrcB [Oceanobacillus bengalensis]